MRNCGTPGNTSAEGPEGAGVRRATGPGYGEGGRRQDHGGPHHESADHISTPTPPDWRSLRILRVWPRCRWAAKRQQLDTWTAPQRNKTRPTRTAPRHFRYKTHPARPKWHFLARFARAWRTLYRIQGRDGASHTRTQRPTGAEGTGGAGGPGCGARGQRRHHRHHTPVTGASRPTTRAASTAITGLSVEHQRTLTPSDRNQMEALHVNEQITPITTIKRHRAAAGRVRHRPRS